MRVRNNFALAMAATLYHVEAVFSKIFKKNLFIYIHIYYYMEKTIIKLKSSTYGQITILVARSEKSEVAIHCSKA